MNAADLKRIVEKHGLWLCGEPGGERADLSGANLARANLSDANLSSANLSSANLSGANLSRADLSGANLSSANLSDANLSRANLPRANLSDAYLPGANLSDANLSRANLPRANLSGANLSRANLSGANLSRANLSGANLARANLSDAYLPGANLARAYLPGANLSRADLSGANLSRANLSRANLSGANLSSARGFDPELLCDLLMLLDQPAAIRAYKLVKADGNGPYNGGIKYAVGGLYEVASANTDPNALCGAGIHVATLPWVMREWQDGYRVLVVEFTADDIACIPTTTDGKFRLHRCRVVAEKDVSRLVRVMRGEAVKP